MKNLYKLKLGSVETLTDYGDDYDMEYTKKYEAETEAGHLVIGKSIIDAFEVICKHLNIKADLESAELLHKEIIVINLNNKTK